MIRKAYKMGEHLAVFKKVQEDKSGKRYQNNKSLWVWIGGICVCVLVAGIILGTIVLGVIRNRQYWSYVNDFSNSTAYAYQKGSLQVNDEGDTYILLGDSVYLPYNFLHNLKMGRAWDEVPEGSESICFDYGNGSFLQIWDVEVKNAKRGSRGLYVKFVTDEGKIYQFDVDGASISKIRSALNRKKGEFKINTFTND